MTLRSTPKERGTAHHHPERGGARSVLREAVILTAVTCLAEWIGGLSSGSLALLSDAGHVFMDLTALLFALAALRWAQRAPSVRRTFGFHRMEVLATLVNGILLVGIALWIFLESVGRISSPVTPRVVPMAVLGILGLLVNLLVAWRLRPFSGADMNLRAVFLHVASDALSSVGVTLGALVIHWTGWTFVDPLMALVIGGIILLNAVGLLRDALNLLLEGVPRHLRLKEVEEAILAVPGVVGVGDLHLWGLCSHLSSLSAHVTVLPELLGDVRTVLEAINVSLREKFAITHTTLQLEPHAPETSFSRAPR